MKQQEYITTSSLGVIQEVATRALQIAGGEEVASASSAQISEDVSIRIASMFNGQEGQ